MCAETKPKMSRFTRNLMIRLYWYINGQPACPTMSPLPCSPMRPSQKPKGTAWQRSKTSDKLLGSFRLARAVKIEDPDFLQTTSGFNCAVCYMPPAQTWNSRITQVGYSSTQCGLSTSLTSFARNGHPKARVLARPARPARCSPFRLWN